MIVYSTISVLAALSGILLASRLNGASPNLGEMFELDAIAAVVIGGTSLSGGSGTIGGTVIGALIIGVLNNGMSLSGRLDLLPADHQGLDHHPGGLVRRSAEAQVGPVRPATRPRPIEQAGPRGTRPRHGPAREVSP